MDLATREVRLDNGLKVILREVHAAPVVSTWIWYRVGSRNEVEGTTGMSHWVEHMMFKGSGQFPKGAIMRAVNRHGGDLNAMTSYDFTAYYEILPSSHAELALRVEADRMRTAAFDPAEVELERAVIVAEREAAENQPSYVLAEQVSAAAFRVHPYGHQTIGWKEDLLAITRDQLYAHYGRHYVPNNAVLVVVGHFDATTQLALVERYFGAISTGELPGPVLREEPVQLAERRVTVRIPGSVPMVRISYHTPPVSHPDHVPLVVLDAILSGGRAMFAFGESQARSARLYRALVETQLASSAGSSYHPSLDPFLFSLGATVREGSEPQAVEEALVGETRRLQEEPVREGELAVAVRQTRAQFAYSSESVSGQALTMGFLEMVDSHVRMGSLLAELARVTPEDVARVARGYLREDNCVVGWLLPAQGPDDPKSCPGRAPDWKVPNRGAFAYSGAQLPSISPETVVRRELDNGIVALVRENPTVGSVTIEGDIRAGSVREGDATAGLASLTAAMLRRGTSGHSFQEINLALDRVGASLGLSAGRDIAGFGGRALAEDLDLLIELLAEMLMEPTFPQTELDRLRGQICTQLDILDADTGYRADRAFMASLYPAGHPYARPVMGTRETVLSLSVGELSDFHTGFYHPGTLAISVVGAVEAVQVIEKLAATLGQWRVEGPVQPSVVPPAETPAGIATERVQLPGKGQVDLIWGVVGMARTSPEYYPAVMANLVLGGLGLMGRLGESVRDIQGLAYYATSSLHAGLGPHPWNVMAGVSPANVERAVGAILREVERLREDPISDQEWEDCRAYLIGSLPLRLETSEGIAGLLLTIERYGLGLDYLQRYPDIIQGITKQDVQRVVRKYLTLDRYALSMAGSFD